jgi:hypothetical protein
MKALLILIERQIIDSTKYFVIAGLTGIVLIFAIITVFLTDDLNNISSYTSILIVIAPLLISIGCCALGLIQTQTDRSSGITEILSVLPVRHSQILLAQIFVGICVIMTVMLPLTALGALLWKLSGPPEWLFHNWLLDLFTGLSLTALACFLFGLNTGHRAKTLVSSLCSLALTPIPLLLIFIRGFGMSLLVILIPLIFILLLSCFNPRFYGYLVTIATGILAIVCLTILLCLGRYLCNGSLVIATKPSIKICPSGLLSPEIENDPNVQEQSEILAKTNLPQRRQNCVICRLLDSCNLMATRNFQVSHYILENSGIMKYFLSLRRGEYSSYSIPHFGRGRTVNAIHLDIVGGQLVHRLKSTNKLADQFTWQWDDAITKYAGPEGVSTKPNDIGRFSSPTVFFEPDTPLPWRRSPPPCIVYDMDSKRFYFVDFERQIIHEGPKIEDPSIEPYETGLLPQWEYYSPAEFRLTSTKSYRVRLPIETIQGTIYLPIVSKSGRIDLLDLRTPRIIGPVGQLPQPRTLFGIGSSEPRYLLDYDVDVVSVIPAPLRLGSDKAKVGIIGILAVSVSRQGMWTSLAVFDKDGKKIKSADSKSAFFDVSGGPALTITKYIFESLHPPVLTLASFFTAYSFDARSMHRALFLMPNSFVAMARDYEGNIFYKFLLVLLLMLPGILFTALLGRVIARDAAIIGLSNKARRLWLAGTLVFGLPAYITYRLTRPKITLVTCANCGKPRRPDTNICHHCGSKWDVPELTPPKWRVLNGGE